MRKFDDSRVTEQVDMTQCQDQIKELVQSAIDRHIAPDTGRQVQWFEAPQLLKYEPGGFYANHADSENYDPGSKSWQRVIDRDYSLLLYLNGDFEGGEIHFTNFNYKLKPTPGMLVYFPSDSRYSHTALSVTSGQRFAVVSWMAMTDTEKMRPPPKGAVLGNP